MKYNAKTQEVESLSDLLDQTKPFKAGEWIFRGVNDAAWPLLPSIGRVRHASVSQKVGRGEEQHALWRFRDKVRPYFDLVIENPLEWMAVAQHHGLPTRLLDWTHSPLVAAYFATDKIEDVVSIVNKKVKSLPIDGVVYAVKRPPKVGPSDRNGPFKIDRVKLFEPPYISERIPRQVSTLTIHPDPQTPWKPKGLMKFIIPKRCKLGIKNELDRLGINQESLFPGVDAAAAYLRWQLKWNKL